MFVRHGHVGGRRVLREAGLQCLLSAIKMVLLGMKRKEKIPGRLIDCKILVYRIGICQRGH